MNQGPFHHLMNATILDKARSEGTCMEFLDGWARECDSVLTTTMGRRSWYKNNLNSFSTWVGCSGLNEIPKSLAHDGALASPF